MAESEDGQEKTEEPTGKRLEDARDKGQVTKSIELNSLIVFGSGLFLVYLTKAGIGQKFSAFAVESFGSLEKFEMNKTIIQAYILKWALFFFSIVGPVVLTIMVASLAGNIAQVGFKFKMKPLVPKFDRFNLFKGIKRIFFSAHSVVEVGKSMAKLLLVGSFTYIILSKLIKDTSILLELNIQETLSFMIDAAFSLVWKIAMLFVLIASSDYVFQKFKFHKDMKMTKEEVKEESKASEGDPKIKAKIRRAMLTMARKRMMKDIPTADVVITNPTHYAIAIKYDMTKNNAPRVVAKGMDELAQRIKKIAMENNVPLHEDRELARALYKSTDVGDEIPTNLFKAVAQILAYIFQMKKMKKKRSIV